MNKFMIHVWGISFRILFWCACIFFTVTRIRVRGALVAIWYQNKILIIHKSYRNAWSIPGGLLSRGETLPQAAVRETFEEVGLRINIQELVYVSEVIGDLGPRNQVQLFEVALESPQDVIIDRREIVCAEFVSPETALQRDLEIAVSTYLRSRLPV